MYTTAYTFVYQGISEDKMETIYSARLGGKTATNLQQIVFKTGENSSDISRGIITDAAEKDGGLSVDPLSKSTHLSCHSLCFLVFNWMAG